MRLTGSETKFAETNTDGSFKFVNLVEGGNYNVQPKQLGVIFNKYSKDFVGVTGEKTIVFAGTAASFSIGGRVTDANGDGVNGVLVRLDGSADNELLTDANGNYSFPACRPTARTRLQHLTARISLCPRRRSSNRCCRMFRMSILCSAI